MRLEHLANLIEISKNPSMSSAARKLHLTPQALSISISSMETELGINLLERSSKGVKLTEDGHKVVKASQDFLEILNKIKHKQIKVNYPSLSGDFYLPVIYGEINYFILALLTDIDQLCPDLTLNVRPLAMANIETALLNNEADIGLSYLCRIDNQLINTIHAELQFIELFQCRLFALIPDNLSISDYRTISFKSLLPYHFILHRMDNDTQPILGQLYHYYYHDGENLIFRNSSPWCNSLIAQGRGVGLYLQPRLSNMTKSVIPRVHFVPIKDNIVITYGYFKKEDHSISPTSEKFIELLTKYIFEKKL